MNIRKRNKSRLEFHSLTPDRWEDFENLFGKRGACGGCWCMWWRLTHSDFESQKGEDNRKAMKKIVESGEEPGLLAYADNKPVGWCALGQREKYPLLERSRILRRVDNLPVWSVVCFFIDKTYRGQGMTVKLLEAAVEHVKKKGGTIVEGYPVEPRKDRAPDVFVYTGLVSAFRSAGFVECARRSETRPIMRYTL